MPKQWRFNPARKSRCVQTFDEFANSNFAADAFNHIARTWLGRDVLDNLELNKYVEFSCEPMDDCFGQYVPHKRNLDNKAGNGGNEYGAESSLIVIDSDDVDKALLPFILGHEGFHGMQDRTEFSGLVPMFNNGVIYNSGVYRLGDKKEFIRAFKAMERACDVVATVIAWEMRQNGDCVNLFAELCQNPHMTDIANCIKDAGEWAKEQPGFLRRDVMDYCMFWGNMGGMWSQTYNDYLDKAATQTYKTTENSPVFSHLPVLETASVIDFSHYALISPNFPKRQWNLDEDFAAIEKSALKKRRNTDFIIQEAMDLADRIRNVSPGDRSRSRLVPA